MKTIVKIFTALVPLTRRIGTCGNVGLIAGAIAGLLLFTLDFMYQGLSLTNADAARLAAVLTAFTWLTVIFFLCIFVRLTFASVAIPSFINCAITCFLTVFVVKWLNAYPFAYIIGIILGIIVGVLLCRLNYIFSNLIKQ
jgi:hypothetical protein